MSAAEYKLGGPKHYRIFTAPPGSPGLHVSQPMPGASCAARSPENAWHSLVELGPVALPHVIQAFATARDQSVALALVSVGGEYRTEVALPFLTESTAKR